MGDLSKGERSAPQVQGGNGQPKCPLCRSAMVLRRRDPLVRAFGFVLLYVAALLFLIWLPPIRLGQIASVLIIGVCGAALMRNPKVWWCPDCWFVSKVHSAGTL